jgi:hypothetical protein
MVLSACSSAAPSNSAKTASVGGIDPVTALAFITAPNYLIVASDGALSDPTGKVVAIGSKSDIIERWSAVLAFRGHQIVQDDLLREARALASFDDFVERVPGILRAAIDRAEHGIGESASGTLFFGGWSESRKAFESYRVGSTARQVRDGETEFTTEPFAATRLPDAFAAPGPSPELYARFGLDLPCNTIEDEKNYAARLICAARAAPPSEGEICFAIGGFLKVTHATRSGVAEETVHHWPDPIGEHVDPSRGEAMPAFLEPRAAVAN